MSHPASTGKKTLAAPGYLNPAFGDFIRIFFDKQHKIFVRACTRQLVATEVRQTGNIRY